MTAVVCLRPSTMVSVYITELLSAVNKSQGQQNTMIHKEGIWELRVCEFQTNIFIFQFTFELRYGVLTVVAMKSTVFSNVTLCWMTEIYQRFRETFYLFPQVLMLSY
jgi:hypothetical protein